MITQKESHELNNIITKLSLLLQTDSCHPEDAQAVLPENCTMFKMKRAITELAEYVKHHTEEE